MKQDPVIQNLGGSTSVPDTTQSPAPAQSQRIRIFALNDCDWYAGADLESCIQDYLEMTSAAREDVIENPHELDDEAMDRLVFVDDTGDTTVRRSFREQLDRMIAEGVEFPNFFASTEY